MVRLRELIVAGKGAPDGNVNASKGKETKADNISICSDLFAEPKPRKKKADTGNSRAYRAGTGKVRCRGWRDRL